VLQLAVHQHPQAPKALVGYSMGGNILFKLLGELGGEAVGMVHAAVAVAPPVDLQTCATNVVSGWNRLYGRSFVRRLMKNLRARRQYPEIARLPLSRMPADLVQFDDRFTAPLSGFASAEEYYACCSAAPLLDQVAVASLILAAEDDPLVPVDIFQQLPHNERVRIHVAEGGGHVGFFARRSADPDRCWMDWRILEWLSLQLPFPNQLRLPGRQAVLAPSVC
jgi:predicted alpha/beta-fold hydrolase